MKFDTNQIIVVRFIKANHKARELKWYESTTCDSIQAW